MFEVGFDDAARCALRSGRSRRLLSALLTAIAFTVLTATFAAGSANAAFSVTDWGITPTGPQAGQHPNVNLRIAVDAVAGDKTGDDLKSAQLDLPAGLLVNPQAVATPCTASQLTADTCPAASQIGKISLQYRIGSSTITSPGSVYSTTPAGNSAINFGFVVRPTSTYAKFSFSSGATTGLTAARSGADVDYGLTLSVPAFPNTVKALGLSIAMTISNVSIDLFPRSGATQTGPYFTYNPTRCSAANSRAVLVSYKAVSFTRTASFTPTGCDTPRFDPTISVTPSDSTYGKSTGISTTVTMPTAEQATQQSELRDVSVTLPAGSILDANAVNAITSVCTDAQFASDICPAGSQIGTAQANTPLLPANMTGAIYLMNKSGFQFGWVLRGARGATTLLRGSAAPATSAPGGLRLTFPSLPQIPLASVTINLSSKLVINPMTCQSQFSYGDILGYTGAHAGVNQFYNVTGCPPPPDTAITAGPTDWSRTATPTFDFTSTPAGAAFECEVDAGPWAACTAPFSSPTLSEGWHNFQVRAIDVGGADASPAYRHFQVDTVKPTLTLSSPSEREVINGTSVTANFVAEPGAATTCSLDSASLTACTSPKTYSGLASGTHTLVVMARDAAGNYSLFQPRHFTIAAAPVVTINTPANNSRLGYDGVDMDFRATSPSGTALTFTCGLFDVTNNSDSLPEPCENGFRYRGLDPGTEYRVEVTATDENGVSGSASANFTAYIPLPSPPSTLGGPGGVATTDRTPTFPLRGGDKVHPIIDFECAIAPAGTTNPTFESCGSAPLSSITPPSDLPNGNYTLFTRSRTFDQVSTVSKNDFSVTDWAPTYLGSVSTTQAGAHPDLDFNIKPNAGQLRSLDMLLPKGMIGSLNSFAKCPLESVNTPYNCPANTQVGTVSTQITITQVTIEALGEVYLTEPQQPGDAAGLSIYVHTALSSTYDNVVIPLRLQLVDNSQYLRTFSDSIPISTKYHNSRGDKFDANFFVKDFTLHLNGSAGSPFPLLTNPSSCTADAWQVALGDEPGNIVSAPQPFQATGCDSVPFDPTFTHTFSNPVAGGETGVDAVITAPEGNSTLDSIRVLEPPNLAPNFPAFGNSDDKCPTIGSGEPFDNSACPSQSLVGDMTITSQLLPDPIFGQVYLIAEDPLPWFGVAIDDPATGVAIRLVGQTSTPQVDPACNPIKVFCQTQIAVDFGSIPDLPVSSIDFHLAAAGRTGSSGQSLGEVVRLANKGATSCKPTVTATASIKPQSSISAVTRSATQSITGC